MELRRLYFLAVDGDCVISVELFNTVAEAVHAKKKIRLG